MSLQTPPFAVTRFTRQQTDGQMAGSLSHTITYIVTKNTHQHINSGTVIVRNLIKLSRLRVDAVIVVVGVDVVYVR